MSGVISSVIRRYDFYKKLLPLAVVLLLTNAKVFGQQNNVADTCKAILMIFVGDTTEKPYLQIPIFARNGYVIIKRGINQDDPSKYLVLGFLDWFKHPLPQGEKVWEYRSIRVGL